MQVSRILSIARKIKPSEPTVSFMNMPVLQVQMEFTASKADLVREVNLSQGVGHGSDVTRPRIRSGLYARGPML
jgi:hypothetical protein